MGVGIDVRFKWTIKSNDIIASLRAARIKKGGRIAPAARYFTTFAFPRLNPE